MDRKERSYSLKFRLRIGAVVLMIGICGLFTLSFFCGVSIMQEETRLAVKSSLSLYSSQLEGEFHKMDLCLAEYVSYVTDINTIRENRRNSIQWGAAVQHIMERLRYSLSSYPANNFFLYIPDTELFMTPVGCSVSEKDDICNSIDDAEWSSPEAQGKWLAMPSNHGYYYRAVRIHRCYIGAWIQADAFLDKMCGSSSETYRLCSPDGNVLGQPDGLGRIAEDNFANSTSDAYSLVEYDGSRKIMMTSAMNFADLYLLVLIPDTAENALYYLGIAAVILLLVFFLLVSSVEAIRRGVTAPLERLTHTIEKAQRGEWDAADSECSRCREFRLVSEAFNKMMAEIVTLKIDRYEQQISWQKTEMEYLKQQITPHFMINCLNTIYQLFDSRHPELAKKMTRDMSKHIRYTLSTGDTVPLAAEAEHVENYVALSNIRYHDSIELDMKVDPFLLQCKVIPLILLNFVENTIKHEVRIRRKVVIHIAVLPAGTEDEPQIAIQIWDTGGGFSDNVLEAIRDMESYSETAEGHIGICNVYKRAKLQLGWCRISFCNRPGAGAQIDILLPKTPF